MSCPFFLPGEGVSSSVVARQPSYTMVFLVQQAIIFALTLIPVAITSLALLGFVSEFFQSFAEPNFAALTYDYIVGKFLDTQRAEVAFNVIVKSERFLVQSVQIGRLPYH